MELSLAVLGADSSRPSRDYVYSVQSPGSPEHQRVANREPPMGALSPAGLTGSALLTPLSNVSQHEGPVGQCVSIFMAGAVLVHHDPVKRVQLQNPPTSLSSGAVINSHAPEAQQCLMVCYDGESR